MSETKSLGEICLKITDGSHSSPKAVEIGGIPMYSVKDMTEYEFDSKPSKRISRNDYEKLVKSGCQPQLGDVLIAKDGSVLKHVFAFSRDEDCALLSSIAILRPNPELVLSDYLVYAIKNPSFREDVLTNYVTGSGVPRIILSDFKRMEIELPTLDEQRRILSSLNPIDEKIRVNQAISGKLVNIGRTLYKSWFVDFEAADLPTTGQLPEGWFVASLGELGLEIESGSRPKGGVSSFTSGIPSIGAESINGVGVFDTRKTKFVPEEYFAKLKRGIPEDFDVILYKDGGKPGEFKPRVGMYGLGFPFERYAINEHVFALRSAKLGQPFLYFFIEWSKTLDVLKIRGIKAAIPGINQQDVTTLEVVVPTDEKINKFNSYMQPILELVLRLSAESQRLAILRDSLIPKLVNEETVLP